MFQFCSYQYQGYNQATDQYRYLITITDSEFGTEEVAALVARAADRADPAVAAAATSAVIQLYTNRNYSINQVAKELWRLFEFNVAKWSWWSVDAQVKYFLQYLPEYLPYHKHIQTLLLFS
jgi:hypothetical protein